MEHTLHLQIWPVLLFPLIGFVINGLFGNKLGNKTSGWIASAMVGLSFIWGIVLFFKYQGAGLHGTAVEQTLFSWIAAGNFNVNVAYQIDPLSLVMLLVVTGVGFLIHVYSNGYMKGDPGTPRYFTYLNLFIFMMLNLILANNFLLMFLGWEGVGLCSYLLIGFWFEDEAKATAGKKAFIVNRVGDFGFLLGMFLLYSTFGTLHFSSIFAEANTLFVDTGVITAITLLFFVGAMGKSAQIPLYVWLPDAMAGPTPVSALIHAATMVTAGVYMVARSNALYSLAPISQNVVAWVGAITAVFAATIALVQNDIKKVLAYSTISQLGYMFIGVGVGAYAAGVFHLMTHAFFKALLFLAAGSVIHIMEHAFHDAGIHGKDPQDIRNMGGLHKYAPFTAWSFYAAWFAIIGIPLFSGFFSKDEILAKSFGFNPWIWALGAFGAILTAFYMSRLTYLTFFGKFKGNKETENHLHESPGVMTIPLVILGVLSVIGGYIGIPKLLGGSNHFEHFVASVAPEAESIHHLSHGTEWILLLISIVLAVGGLLIALAFYHWKKISAEKTAERFGGLYRLLLDKYRVDELYNFLIVQPIVKGSRWLWQYFDAKFIDGFFVNGIASTTKFVGDKVRKVQTGVIPNYALFISVGTLFIMLYFLIW